MVLVKIIKVPRRDVGLNIVKKSTGFRVLID